MIQTHHLDVFTGGLLNGCNVFKLDLHGTPRQARYVRYKTNVVGIIEASFLVESIVVKSHEINVVTVFMSFVQDGTNRIVRCRCRCHGRRIWWCCWWWLLLHDDSCRKEKCRNDNERSSLERERNLLLLLSLMLCVCVCVLRRLASSSF
jgi:hypothetical protein